MISPLFSGTATSLGKTVCSLPLRCRFGPGNPWGNSPPPEQKKIVRHQRTTVRHSVHGRLLRPAQDAVCQQTPDTLLGSILLDGGQEGSAVLCGQHGP